jgi:hypothetical protein
MTDEYMQGDCREELRRAQQRREQRHDDNYIRRFHDERLETELTSLRTWEELQLLELGFPRMAARELAEAGVSWHDAEALLEKGCPVPLAYGMLLP